MEQVACKKPKATPQQFKLTERDTKLLRYIGENRFITIPEIRKRFWADSGSGNEFRRLRILRKNGFIEKLTGDKDVTLGYRIGKKGRKFIQFLGIENESSYPKISYKTAFDHDEKLLKVREVLEKSPLVSEYIPEHMVRMMLGKRHGKQRKRDETYKVPDALFKLKTAQGTFPVALELECTRKTYKRYRHFLGTLATTKDAKLIFVVCEDSKTLLILRNLLEEVRNENNFVKVSKTDNGFYFVLLQNLLTEDLDAILDGEGKRFSLNSLAKEFSAIR